MWWPQLEPKLNAIPDSSEIAGDLATIFVERQLFALQQAATCRTVWAICPDPYDHALDHSIWDGVAKNIERGVAYTFVVPESKADDGALLRLIQLGKTSGHPVTVVGIKDETFSVLAITDYVVINPSDSRRGSFWRFPPSRRATGWESRAWPRSGADAIREHGRSRLDGMATAGPAVALRPLTPRLVSLTPSVRYSSCAHGLQAALEASRMLMSWTLPSRWRCESERYWLCSSSATAANAAPNLAKRISV